MGVKGRKTLFKLVTALLATGLALTAAEGGARIYFALDDSGKERARALLAGERRAAAPSASIGQPFLFMVPAPGYGTDSRDAVSMPGEKLNHEFTNEQGYRGDPVAMRREPGTVRVLCLGGSTTYGWGTLEAHTSYPAQLQRLLRQHLPPGVRRFEVINGGVPGATSAELFTHYHFKWHYFSPDLVIVHTGGNDAEMMASPHYQPDYSHRLKPFDLPKPLAPLGQMVLKSRLAALFVLRMLQGSDPAEMAGGLPRGSAPPTHWHPASYWDRPPGQRVSDEELAFTHNLEALLDEVQRDGAKLLLVPFRYASDDFARPESRRTERILKRTGRARRLPVAPFPRSVISKANWVDPCHVNAAGCRQKAEHIAPYVRRLLSDRGSSSPSPGRLSASRTSAL